MSSPYLPSPELIALLRCPETKQPVRLLTAEEAAAHGLESRPALLREDGTLAYLFDAQGLPVLLPGSGVNVPRVSAAKHSGLSG